MNLVFDHLIIRFILVLIILGLFIFYRFIMMLINPNDRRLLRYPLNPSTDYCEMIYVFGRVSGMAILISSLKIEINLGLLLALAQIVTMATTALALFFGGIFIVESRVFSNFEFEEEIKKRKNKSFAGLSFVISICVAALVRMVIIQSQGQVIIALLFWTLGLVLLGLSTFFYRRFSGMNFQQLMVNKNLALAYSYSGFLMGSTMVITRAFQQSTSSVKGFVAGVFLQCILGLLLSPIFYFGLKKLFQIKEKTDADSQVKIQLPDSGYGIYQGVLYFSSCVFTGMVIGHLQFGTYFPLL